MGKYVASDHNRAPCYNRGMRWEQRSVLGTEECAGNREVRWEQRNALGAGVLGGFDWQLDTACSHLRGSLN